MSNGKTFRLCRPSGVLEVVYILGPRQRGIDGPAFNIVSNSRTSIVVGFDTIHVVHELVMGSELLRLLL